MSVPTFLDRQQTLDLAAAVGDLAAVTNKLASASLEHRARRAEVVSLLGDLLGIERRIAALVTVCNRRRV